MSSAIFTRSLIQQGAVFRTTSSSFLSRNLAVKKAKLSAPVWEFKRRGASQGIVRQANSLAKEAPE
jgi:hypothetical protein